MYLLHDFFGVGKMDELSQIEIIYEDIIDEKISILDNCSMVYDLNKSFHLNLNKKKFEV
mgnify:CR=1 FL=1